MTGMGMKRVVLAGLLGARSAWALAPAPGALPTASQSEHSVEPQQRGRPSETNAVADANPTNPPRVPQGWTGDRVALLGHLGIGAAAGSIGVALDIAPIRFFALQMGAGVSLNGPQLALIPRLRLPVGKGVLFTLGDGVSAGRYKNERDTAGLGCVLVCMFDSIGGERPAEQIWKRAYWNNFELGFDFFPSRGRGTARVSAGYAALLNERDYACKALDPSSSAPGGGCERTSGHGLIYLSTEFGLFL